jgi:hypothetical protein
MKQHFVPKKPDASAAPAGPRLGAMAKRSKQLKRGDGELFSVLDKYLDGAISTSDKRARVTEERDLLAKMEDVTRDVLGREADESMQRNELKASLRTTYELRKQEVYNWDKKWSDKAQLHKEKETRMMQVKSELMGTTSVLKLGKLPEVLGRGGCVGKVVEYIEHMRTWLDEEANSTHAGLEVCQDRLFFAAKVSSLHTTTPTPCPQALTLRSEACILSSLVRQRPSRS